MHPFYGPSSRLLSGGSARGEGLVSMAAYLAFWAGVVVMAYRVLDERFPPAARVRAASPLDLLRTRYALGEIDREQFLVMQADLQAAVRPSSGGAPP